MFPNMSSMSEMSRDSSAQAMVNDKRTSHGRECEGEHGTGRKCRRSRARPGKPVILKANCAHCDEPRCRAHCRCARKGQLRGRNKARAPSAQAPSAPSIHSTVSTTSHATSLAPVGRAPAPSCELLANAAELYAKACDQIADAAEVEVATYQYIIIVNKLFAINSQSAV